MNNNLIITIGREYGTGGREIGQKLALRLGVPFYDRELITRAAKKTGFDEKLFARQACHQQLPVLADDVRFGWSERHEPDRSAVSGSVQYHPRDGRGFLVCYRRPLCRPCTA